MQGPRNHDSRYLAMPCHDDDWTNALSCLKILQMDAAKIRQTASLVLLASLLVASTWIGLFVKQTTHWDAQEWFHAFCLAQTILLAACAVYGPGEFVARIPFVVAWGLAVGFALARLNLISPAGSSSLVAGAILVSAGTLAALIVFVLHRWRTSVSLRFRPPSDSDASRRRRQISLRAIMLLTAAFAITSLVARGATTARMDPFGADHDTLVLHVYLGFFNCLRAAPVLLVAFRPSWKIVLVGFFFAFMTFVEPFMLERAAPYIFEDASLVQRSQEGEVLAEWARAFLFNLEALVATVVYTVLARSAGFGMVYPHQSNDKNPNPSGRPETEAGCVQD